MVDKKAKFIEKARKVHGDRYDYSKVDYIDSLTNVKIMCPIHGEFLQTPQAHIRGHECPMCANVKRGRFNRMTKEEFVRKAMEIHGDKYDYSKVEYKNANTKVCIICPKHGDFWMLPVNHIYSQRQGCPKCSGRGLTTEEIINMFHEVHKDKYDYSEVVYTKMHDKVKIICPTHGEFLQTPSKHLIGRGCPKCGIVSRIKKRTKSTEQFIEEAKKVHGDKYDYSETVYTSALEKVCIICPIHGKFYQRALDHLHGHGCAKCQESRLEREIKNLLTENNVAFEEQKKFDWLGLQSLDFYLPQYNMAIECQGEQHFVPIDYFGGENEFEVIQERDKRKKMLCQSNGIQILYFSNIENPTCINDKSILLKKIKGTK